MRGRKWAWPWREPEPEPPPPVAAVDLWYQDVVEGMIRLRTVKLTATDMGKSIDTRDIASVTLRWDEP